MTQPPAPETDPIADPAAVERALARLREEQNFLSALSAGSVAALVGAAAWALVTALTKYQIGWMAVGVGFLVGFAVRGFGKGIEPRFGYLGAALALLGCALGNLLAVVAMVAQNENQSFFLLLSRLDWGAVPGVMKATFSPMDLLFYGIALYEGYKLSFRPLTPADLGLPAAEAGPAA